MQTLPPRKPLFGRSAIFEARVLALQNTVAVNYAGNPAIAIPIPLRGRGFPVTSLQLIGPNFSEARLVNAARLLASRQQTKPTAENEPLNRHGPNRPSRPATNTRFVNYYPPVSASLAGAELLALVCGAARAETATALIAKGDAFDERLQASRGAGILSAGGQARTEQRGASRPDRAAIPPLDERHFIEKGKTPARTHLARIRAARRDSRAE